MSVRPDNVRATLTAVALVPGDTVKMSSGAVVAAAVRLMKGGILLDQSMLAGESVLIEAGPGFQTFAGGLVRRGEAVAEVTAAGARTKFEPTALRTLAFVSIVFGSQASFYAVRERRHMWSLSSLL